MYAEKTIHALLTAAAPITALVADRCYAGQLPQATPLPALVVDHISSMLMPTLDATSGYNISTTRIQVTALCTSYPAVKNLLQAVKDACAWQRGVIAGVTVLSIRPDLRGPDGRDDDRSVFYQSLDFTVIFQEP